MKGFPAFFIILLVLGVYSCKTIKPATTQTQESEPQVEEEVEVEPVAEPLPEADTTTLVEVSDTVSIVEEVPVIEDSLSVIGVGDIMMGTNFPGLEYLPPDNGASLLNEEIVEILKSADVTFGNLEGVLLDEGGQPKNCNNPKACYLFRSPLFLSANLVKAGFDVLSVANNHAGDFGDEGRESTSRSLDSLEIAHAGFTSRPYALLERKGLTIGFTAFSPNAGTLSIHDLIKAEEIITHLDSTADIVIVSFHAGAEGAAYQHVTRDNEIFYGEDRGNVYEFAHLTIDWGADIVLGHGPHVTRGIELYNERFIAYSLGNFCTYARFNLRGPNGFAPILNIYVNNQGEFLSGNIIPVRQIGLGYPVLDNDSNVISLIRALSEKDFPESPLSIGDSGNILYIQNQ